MQAMVLQKNGGFCPGELPTPVPAQDEALIRVLACGICSSDLGAWRKGLGTETVLGHEVVGIVEQGGRHAGLAPGTRVTGCILGGYAQYTIAKAADLIPVPDSLPTNGAMVEPYVCLLSGLRRCGAAKAPKTAVVGAGFMGLGLTRLLKLEGAPHVTVFDLSPEALGRARELGADQALPAEGAEGAYDLVFEAAGTQSALDLAGRLCAPYGTVGMIGYHPCARPVDLGLWAARALTAVCLFEYRKPRQLACMREALARAQAGDLPTARLITHQFPLEALEAAFETHRAKAGGYVNGWMIANFS
jgi:threonine dehydrogenase-like Zn-dependent dehydrogenase